MLSKPYLMVPGPTPVPDQVLAAMHRPMINHRGPQFAALFQEVNDGLRKVFQTKHDVLMFPSSGTGVMEAAIVNLFSPGDKVLAVSVGAFGDRFAEVAARFGLNVEKMDFPWGLAADPAQVAARLAGDTAGEIKAVLVTHNETSTGVVNDIAAISAARGQHPALLVVDAVSSLGAIRLEMDAWRLDAVITSSQKALMLPPGLGFLALNERAWQYAEQAQLPRYYWDARQVRKSLAKGQNPYTPPVALLFGLAESLRLMEEEGLDNIWARHVRLRDAMRQGLKALGCGLLAPDAVASPAVTAVLPPAGLEAKTVQKYMREHWGITVAGGQKKLENKIFRIGHLGYAAAMDIIVALAGLEMTLAALGAPVAPGAGVAAAEEILREA